MRLWPPITSRTYCSQQGEQARSAEGFFSWLIALPGEAAVLPAKIAHAGEVITLALVPVEATHTPACVKCPAEFDRQLLVSGARTGQDNSLDLDVPRHPSFQLGSGNQVADMNGWYAGIFLNLQGLDVAKLPKLLQCLTGAGLKSLTAFGTFLIDRDTDEAND